MKDGSLDLGTNVKPITPNRASSIRGTKIPTVASDNLANSQSDSRTVNAKHRNHSALHQEQEISAMMYEESKQQHG